MSKKFFFNVWSGRPRTMLMWRCRVCVCVYVGMSSHRLLHRVTAKMCYLSYRISSIDHSAKTNTVMKFWLCSGLCFFHTNRIHWCASLSCLYFLIFFFISELLVQLFYDEAKIKILDIAFTLSKEAGKGKNNLCNFFYCGLPLVGELSRWVVTQKEEGTRSASHFCCF